MNTKAIIVSTLFTAVLAGTSAFAQKDANSKDFEDLQTSSATKEVQKVRLQATVVSPDETALSAKK